jgi:hypothetical protein
MPHDPGSFKVYPIKDLATLKAYAKHAQEHTAKFLEIQARAEDEINKMHEEHRAAMKILWEDMCEQAGLDPEKTWDSEEWSAELHYLDAGFGALVYHPDDTPLLRRAPCTPTGTMH